MRVNVLCFLVVVLFASLVPLTSAVTVSDPVIMPTGDLTPGTNVSASFKITMVPLAGVTFPNDNTLQLYTDLNNAQWKVTMIRDGVEHEIPQDYGKTIYLSGWILSYPDKVDESLRIALSGIAPSVSKSANKSIVLVQELDRNINVIPLSVINKERTIVNPTDLVQNVLVREGDLKVFRIHLDNQSAAGVNVSAALAKYTAAQAAINDAKSAQYAAGMALLSNASLYIDEGEKLLDRAWAEKEIADASAPLTTTKELIVYFTVNKSVTTADPRLAVIIAKKESAEQYLSTANDMLVLNNYAFARTKAKEAFVKANESYNDALALKQALGGGTGGGGGGNWFTQNLFIIIAGIIVVVIAAVWYVYLRPRNRWGEY